MQCAVYGDLFQQSLEELISAGGDVGEVVTLVNAYQRTDPIARQFAFQDWVAGFAFTCSRCAAPFFPDPDSVEEDAQIVCRKCLD